MTGTIKVDTAKLRQTASSFNGEAYSVQHATNRMVDIVNQLTGYIWTGEAQTKYRGKFNGLRDDIHRMVRMINEHVTDLQDMAATYEGAEQENIIISDTLESDVIS